MLKLIVIRAIDMEKLAEFYSVLGLSFTKHRHGKGPEHLSAVLGETVFEIYPARGDGDLTSSIRLGFSVKSLSEVIRRLREMNVEILTEPMPTEFGVRAVVKDFEGHKVELYEERAD